jgi:hypothetical protein
MSSRYTVKNIVCESGERLALLLDTSTGLPIFDVTVYIVAEVRGKNRSSATIEQVLRSLKVLLLFCDLRDISLDVRMQEGRL